LSTYDYPIFFSLRLSNRVSDLDFYVLIEEIYGIQSGNYL
jgi:hypothetical protein